MRLVCDPSSLGSTQTGFAELVEASFSFLNPSTQFQEQEQPFDKLRVIGVRVKLMVLRCEG
jgi:hypothetical protein